MPILPMIASILLLASVILYSVSVWAEFLSKRLKRWHVRVFIVAAIANSTAIGMMFAYAGGIPDSGFALVGVVGLVLILVHAGWAIVAFGKNDEKSLATFHKFSLLIWGLWVMTFLSSAYEGISHRMN